MIDKNRLTSDNAATATLDDSLVPLMARRPSGWSRQASRESLQERNQEFTETWDHLTPGSLKLNHLSLSKECKDCLASFIYWRGELLQKSIEHLSLLINIKSMWLLVAYRGCSVTTFSVNSFLKWSYQRWGKKIYNQKWGDFMKGFKTILSFPLMGVWCIAKH